MRKISFVLSLCFFLLICCGALEANATYTERINLDRNGSISVKFYDNKKEAPITSGELELIRIANVAEDNADLSFKYVESFKQCTVSLSIDNDISICAGLFEDYANKNHVIGNKESVNEDGFVIFADLQPGLYLVRQTKAADGYYPANSFVISVPTWDKAEQTWKYDVDATPKMEVLTEMPNTPDNPDHPDTPDSPDTPNNPNTPSRPTTPRLPQTGQQSWMIYTMAVCGLFFILSGWLLLLSRKKK